MRPADTLDFMVNVVKVTRWISTPGDSFTGWNDKSRWALLESPDQISLFMGNSKLFNARWGSFDIKPPGCSPIVP